MHNEILCKKCKSKKSKKGSYWTERHYITDLELLICPHKMAEMNIESIGEKLASLNEQRRLENNH